MRMPERQPEVAGFSSLWWMKEMARHYGYGNVGLAVSYEWMYHSTNPGNLDQRTAAAYNVRDCLLALAYGVPHVNPALAYDVANAYYFSNWGASGLCHRPPELNPKPGYVAYATLTAQLDQSAFLTQTSYGLDGRLCAGIRPGRRAEGLCPVDHSRRERNHPVRAQNGGRRGGRMPWAMLRPWPARPARSWWLWIIHRATSAASKSWPRAPVSGVMRQRLAQMPSSCTNSTIPVLGG